MTSQPSSTLRTGSLDRRAWLRRTAGLAGGVLATSLVRGQPSAGGSFRPEAGEPPRPPNILWIMVDEWKADAFGFEGHPVVQTPNLDRLAREGTHFTNCYAASPVCSPSRASCFTGRYAHVHGVVGNRRLANVGEVYLPSILEHYGYDTAIFGKLHFVPKEEGFGFREFWSQRDEGPYPDQQYDNFLRRKYGPGAGRGSLKPGTCPFPGDRIGGQVGVFPFADEDFENEYLTGHAIAYLRKRRPQDRPFFVFASYLRPHSPFIEPEKWFNMYDREKLEIPPAIPEVAQLLNLATEENQRHARRVFIANDAVLREVSAVYYGACSHVDAEIGRLLAEVEALGLTDDTIVVFCADHGQMLGERGRFFKSLMWENSVRTPLLIKGPRNSRVPNLHSGGTRKEIVELIDVLPTLFEMTGLPLPEGIQGRSLLQLADRRAAAAWSNEAYSWLGNKSMLRTPEHKLVNHDGVLMVYDMTEDPKEERNLMGTRAGRRIAADFLTQLDRRRGETPPAMHIPGMSLPDYAVDPEIRARAPREGPVGDEVDQ